MRNLRVNIKDVLYLLRLYRHDLMNHLQLVDGYASMKQYEQSQEKLHHLIMQLKNERQLQTLDAPQYVYWLLSLNLFEREMNFDFEIENHETSIEDYDGQITHDGKRLFEQIKAQLDSLIHLHILVQIKYDHDWYIKYHIKGIESLDDITFYSYGQLKVIKNEKETSFVFTYK